MNPNHPEYARCHGIIGANELCPMRRSCLRYKAEEGDFWLTPKVEDRRCWDYLTPFGWAMIKGMMEEP